MPNEEIKKRKNIPSKRRRYIHTYIYTQNCVSENETGESEVNVM
jgi:hypothetical protein